MTEKEFENLKIGDKVWIIADWYPEFNPDYQAVQIVVQGKEWGEESNGSVIHCGSQTFRRWECFLKKSEAWEKKVREDEENVRYAEMDLDGYKKHLAHAKSELAKAKEEEESGWVIINEKVYKETPYISFPRTGFQKYPTEREAYEALAKFYLEKYYETRRKVEEIK